MNIHFCVVLHFLKSSIYLSDSNQLCFFIVVWSYFSSTFKLSFLSNLELRLEMECLNLNANRSSSSGQKMYVQWEKMQLLEKSTNGMLQSLRIKVRFFFNHVEKGEYSIWNWELHEGLYCNISRDNYCKFCDGEMHGNFYRIRIIIMRYKKKLLWITILYARWI